MLQAKALAQAAATKPWGQPTVKTSPGLNKRGAIAVAKTSPWKPETRRPPPTQGTLRKTQALMDKSLKTRPW